MAVILLRHTTPDVARGTCYGETDLPLAASFATEARAVLATLPDMACVISSPLLRCLRLADLVARERRVPLRVDPQWREMDFGRWEGQRWEAIPRAELDAWAADFNGYRGHGGESVADLAARVRAGLADLPHAALVVTHMGCIKAAMAQHGLGAGWEAQLPFGGQVALPTG